MADSRNIICLVIDRLHAGFLGAYGNTWIATPHVDHLAADAFAFDRVLVDSPRLESLYRSYWHGSHALAAAAQEHLDEFDNASLPRQLSTAGYETVLMTDDPSIGAFPSADDFLDREELVLEPSEEVASSIEETQLARFFAAASERQSRMRRPFLLWLHTGSLGRIWDAPLEFRNQYRDDEDPPPLQSTWVPSRLLPRDYDPDEVLGIVHSYAGQVSLLDLCIGSFLEALTESRLDDETLLAVLSARGISLGEHGGIGPQNDSLHSEVTQVPWLLRLPSGAGQSARTQALVQPADLFATLTEWCGLPGAERPFAGAGRSVLPLVDGASETIRDRACTFLSASQWAISTSAWSLLQMGGGPAEAESVDENARSELYVKPDDRFEVNEVADRCPDCVIQLREAFAQFQQSCESVDSPPPPPLPEILVSGME
jgi:arylsulfatase A-like enzyme